MATTELARRILGVTLAVAWAVPAGAQDLGDLSTASLEALLNVRITSVSKKAQDLFKSASAIYVITADDMRRSGATSVADALRIVPGLSVGRMSGAFWRVGSRGFASQYADKLLVLIDGMSVYDTI